MKKQSNLSRLLEYAGTYRILTCLSWALSAAGALLALAPFVYIWRILREVIEVAPRYENAVHVTHYGWMAVAFAVAAVLIYIAGLIKNKTVLIIAHRMRTVSGADKIVVLKDGVVAEQGSPAQLLQTDGIFARMVQLQTESQKWTLAKAQRIDAAP